MFKLIGRTTGKIYFEGKVEEVHRFLNFTFPSTENVKRLDGTGRETTVKRILPEVMKIIPLK